MGCSANQIINQAKSWLGCKESDGSHKKIIDIYNAHKPLARNYKVKYTDSWCATFVSAVAIVCGATDIIPTECGAEKMVELLKKMGIWEESGSYVPKKGDIIFYDWDGKDTWSDHVGYVASVSGKDIKAIEGNKSDAVGYRTIKVGDKSIRGYGVIRYDGSVTVQQSQPSVSTDGNSVNYQVKVNTPSGVNCRTKPSENGDKITAYANGAVLNITKENNGWLYANGTGWVSGQYCVKVSSSSSGDDSWKGDTKYYLENSAVGDWQSAMNKGFDTDELEVDNKFGKSSQAFAKNHLLWSGQTHNCPTAIKWLQNRLRYYGFSKLSATGEWSDYLDTCVKEFQKNRGLIQDAKVGLETTYHLLEGTIK